MPPYSRLPSSLILLVKGKYELKVAISPVSVVTMKNPDPVRIDEVKRPASLRGESLTASRFRSKLTEKPS